MYVVFKNVLTREPSYLSVDKLIQMINSERVKRIMDSIRAKHKCYVEGELTWEEYKKAYSPFKRQLPAVAWHVKEFTDGQRHMETAVPSGLYILDIDHMAENPWDFYFTRMRERAQKLGILWIALTPSLEGLRTVGILPEGMDIAQAQAWLAKQLGVDYDASCKDLTRLSFLTSSEELLYIDKLALDKGEWQQPVAERPAPSVAAPPSAQPSSAGPKRYPTAYRGIPYADILVKLNERWGGEPAEGGRNTREYELAKELAPSPTATRSGCSRSSPTTSRTPASGRRLWRRERRTVLNARPPT